MLAREKIIYLRELTIFSDAAYSVMFVTTAVDIIQQIAIGEEMVSYNLEKELIHLGFSFLAGFCPPDTDMQATKPNRSNYLNWSLAWSEQRVGAEGIPG